MVAASQRGDFEFAQELGRGSFAVVHKVRRKSDKKVFVCKQVSMRHFTQKRQRDQALREAQIMKQLRSPHIVQYVDAFVETDNFYLILQYCDSGDMKRWMSNTKVIPTATIWRLFLRVTLGLEYLHTRKILHRDVKSENVFLVSGDKAKVGDLGLAKMLTNSCSGGSTLVGTPRYLSPEEVEGCGHYSDKCDTWSLGVILYEMCSDGHRGLFDEATRLPELFRKITRDEPLPLPARTQAALKEMCGMLLKKDPGERLSAADALNLPVAAEHAEKHGVTEMHARKLDSGTAATDLSPSGFRPPSRTSLASLKSARTQSGGSVTPTRSRAGSLTPTPGTPVLHPAETPAAPTEVDPRWLVNDVPTTIYSRFCGALHTAKTEGPLGPRFHNAIFCEICDAQGVDSSAFSTLKRRHHCRSCGRSICSIHSAGLRRMPHLDMHTPQRYCELCSLAPYAGDQPGDASLATSSSSYMLAITAGQKAFAWDTRSPGRPCWTVDEMVQWAGVASCSTAGNQPAFCIVKGGGAIDLHMVDAGGQIAARSSFGRRSATPTRRNPSLSSTTSNSVDVDVMACCGNWMAITQYDKAGNWTVQVIDLLSSKIVGVCVAPPGSETITALGLQPGNKSEPGLLVTGSFSGSVRIWSIPPLEKEASQCALESVLTSHRDGIMAIGFAGNGNFLCTGSRDGTVRAWKRQKAGFDSNAALVCEEFRASKFGAAMSCDGTYMVYTQAPRLGSWEQGASLWNVALGRWERSFFKGGQ